MENIFGENCLRVALIAFNFIFGILSIALIALSLIYSDKLANVKLYVDTVFINFPILLLVLGILSFIVSMFGCFCARTTNRRFFIVFLVVLFCILALDLTVTVIAFCNIETEIIEDIKTVMTEQVTDANVTEKFHQFESLFECCGINNASDYINDSSFNSSFCCGVSNCLEVLQSNNESELWYQSGCASAVENTMDQIYWENAIVGIFCLVLQVLENVCVFIMQGKLKD